MNEKLILFLRVQIAAFEVIEESMPFFRRKMNQKQNRIKFLSSNLLDELKRIPNDRNLIDKKVARLEKAMGQKIPNDVINY